MLQTTKEKYIKSELRKSFYSPCKVWTKKIQHRELEAPYWPWEDWHSKQDYPESLEVPQQWSHQPCSEQSSPVKNKIWNLKGDLILWSTCLTLSALQLIQKSFSLRSNVKLCIVIDKYDEVCMVNKPLEKENEIDFDLSENNIIFWITWQASLKGYLLSIFLIVPVSKTPGISANVAWNCTNWHMFLYK